MSRLFQRKCGDVYYSQLAQGIKDYGVEFNYNIYHVGDVMRHREWSPSTGEYTGRSLIKKISSVMITGCGDERITDPNADGWVICGYVDADLETFGKISKEADAVYTYDVIEATIRPVCKMFKIDEVALHKCPITEGQPADLYIYTAEEMADIDIMDFQDELLKYIPFKVTVLFMDQLRKEIKSDPRYIVHTFKM